MKNIFLAILCSSAFIMTHAQTGASGMYDTGKALQLYIGIGGGYNDYKNLNATLKDNSLPTVGKFTLANSLEADMRHRNLLMGLAGNMGFSYKRTDDYNSLLFNLGGQLNVGYYVFNNKNFHLAPQAGIGFFSSAVNLTQRKDIDDFNEVLTGKNSISINQTVPVLDFCLRFDVADFTKAKTGAGSIRLGYKYGLSNHGWGIDISNNSTVNNSPEDRINQFYVMFSIGTSLLKPQQAK
jgi:hypothetical protein